MLPAKIIQTPVWVPGRVVLTLKVRAVCLKFSFIGCLLILFQVADAQKKVVNAMELPDVDAFLKTNKKALGAAAVVVYKDDKVVFTTTNNDFFNAKTQAPIPGASKWFTAALVLTFVDEGKIKLDDPVSKYLPVMDKYMKSYITIRMCLAHTTGVENSKGSFLAPPKKKFDMLEEEINAYAAKEISNNAGTEFFYGNIGPNIAGRVLEVITKKSFDRLAQERLFRPLKMRATTFTDFDGKAINPSGGAQTTATDMINFLTMILNKGMFENKRILSEASIAEMQKAQFTDKPVKYAPESTAGLHHGLGAWLLEEDAGGNGQVVSALGTFGSYAYLDNCRRYGAVILLQNPAKEVSKEITKQFKDAVEARMGDCKPTN
jgi:CubicO group peptidase (beta-lactamase class C family)